MTIHGRRMPSGEVVRSLMRPKNGFANSATSPPSPAMSASLSGACLIPTRALTFNARVTSKGARKSREVPMYAKVNSVMNRQPARAVTGWPTRGMLGGVALASQVVSAMVSGGQ